jgi:adhesin HecA-like repeat protein
LPSPHHTIRLFPKSLQGRKLVFFDFSVSLKWEGELVNSDGAVTGTGDGQASIAELDQDSGDGFNITVSAAEDGGAADSKLTSLFRSEALPVLRAKIARFVDELKAQG